MTTMSWVSTTAVVFALVATLPLSFPVIGTRPLPLPPLSSVTSSLMFVFFWSEVKRAAFSVPLPLPLSVPFSVRLHRRAGLWPRACALPLVAGPTTVAVAPAGLGVAIAVVTGLGLEVREEGRGGVPPRRRAPAVRARTWARTVGTWATASAVVTVETETRRIRD